MPKISFYNHLAICSLLSLATGLAGCSGGSSSSDIAEETVTLTIPGVPTIGTATPGNESVVIAFTAPSDDGGGIASYTATCVTGSTSFTGTATSSPIEVSGLINGTAYDCSVSATNSAGTGTASGTVSATPQLTGTAGVDCPYSDTYFGEYSTAGNLTATFSWSCSGSVRSLTGNGLPDHEVGTFPNAGNPNTIAEVTVSATMPLEPTMSTTITQVGGPGGAGMYARNSVKIDASTAGTCTGTETDASECNLANGTGQWRIEALSQDVFDFGTDMNNAHVQPTGTYHYHGMPEGLLTNAGVSDLERAMVHVGWAGDGYPIYARYCYTDALDSASELRICEGSYELDATADAGRPDTSWVPLGAFQSDWNYTENLGDLDECNGRFGVTPEFPEGIYYYMATDTYPFFSRCVKGNL